MTKEICVSGVKTHFLKNFTCKVPLHQLVVVAGVSGSGKTSFVFDTIYAEAQRRFIGSLSLQARKFSQQLPRPEVRKITGLIPAIAVTQQGSFHASQTTVGSLSNINDFLRLLFIHIGVPYCPTHHQELRQVSLASLVDTLLQAYSHKKIYILAMLARNTTDSVNVLLEPWIVKGYTRFRVNGRFFHREELPSFMQGRHTVEVVIDRMRVHEGQKERLNESLEFASRIGRGRIAIWDDEAHTNAWYSLEPTCVFCNYVAPQYDVTYLSRRHDHGMCPVCQGKSLIKTWSTRLFFHAFSRPISAHPFFQYCRGLVSSSPLWKDKIWSQCTPKEQERIWWGGKDGQGIYSLLEGQKAFLEANYRKEISCWIADVPCSNCQGTGLNSVARSLYIHTKDQKYNYVDIQACSLKTLKEILPLCVTTRDKKSILTTLREEIRKRLQCLIDVGLPYIALGRSLQSLSAGEAQRVYLASRLGIGLSRLLYVLDEPSNGLHMKDQERLYRLLHRLIQQGNSILMIDHNPYQMRRADYMIRLGPSAGEHGGHLLARGRVPAVFSQEGSITGPYLEGKKALRAFSKQRAWTDWCILEGACGHNLKGQKVSIAVGAFNVVAGVSGAGKSTLIQRTLYPILEKQYKGKSRSVPLPYGKITGTEHWSDVVLVDSTNIPRSAKVTVGSYSGILQEIREIMAQTVTARERGYTARRFSYSVSGGRCRFCAGDGVKKVRLQLLPSIFVQCRHCQGQRYNRATLEVHYQGKNIAEILSMRVSNALRFFHAYPTLQRKLALFIDAGLGYLRLGQSTRRLSGGEIQRLKLVTELLKTTSKKALYIFDEPSMGLHVKDMRYLFVIFQKILDAGHTIVVIDHHLDMIRQADWLIDMGPRGGDNGGFILAMGTVARVKALNQSPTAQYL